MTLMNLMAIADKTLPMTVYAKISDGGKRYNFVTKAWEDSKITVSAITTIGDFINSPVYQTIHKYNLLTFSTQKTETLSGMTAEEKIQYPKVVVITVSPNAMSTRTIRGTSSKSHKR